MLIFFVFILYNVVQLLVFPIFIFYIIYRIIKGKDILGNLKQRLGFIPKTKGNQKVIWIHAVSVGEVLSVQNLIDDIKHHSPDAFCYLTVGTITGRQIAEKNINADCISFMPYDFLPCMLLAFFRIKPASLIIVEAEIWPNFLILSSWLNIRKNLINARVSMRSYNRYWTLQFFFAPIFNSFQAIFTQSEADTKRFLTLGVNQSILTTLGDIKSYNVLPKKHKTQIHNHKLPFTTLLAGSIHSGELDLYIKLFQELKPSCPNLKMILAPRHLTWLEELENKIKNANLNYTIWTQQNNILNGFSSGLNIAQALEINFQNSDILCLGKLGELFNLYQFADLFYLGGTFINVGGHNLLEPAAWALPCIIGPHYQNTKNNAEEMEQAGGLIKVKNYEELRAISQKLLNDAALRSKMGQANFQWLKNQAEKVKSLLTPLISNNV